MEILFEGGEEILEGYGFKIDWIVWKFDMSVSIAFLLKWL